MFWRRRPKLDLDWLQVEVSSVCGGTCTYCPNYCYRSEWAGELMEWPVFERLAPFFPAAKLLYLQGWGEPMLHPRFWDMVRLVKGSGASVGFTTSGETLAAESLQRLLDSRVDIMAVSLAGTTPATHERFRPAASLAKIDETLVRLREMRSATNAPLRLHLAFVLLRSNRHELGELVDLAKRWNAQEIVVSNLTWSPVGSLPEESILRNQSLWPETVELLDRARDRAENDGIEFHYPVPSASGPLAICQENILRSCFVSSSGDVSPCVFSSSTLRAQATRDADGKTIEEMEPIVFGNIKQETLAEIWNSEPARQFREAFRRRWQRNSRGTRGLPQACVRCPKLWEITPSG